MSTHNYDLTNDFVSGINAQKFIKEVGDQIEKTFNFRIKGDDIRLKFDISLTAEEQTILDTIVSSHDATVPPVIGNYALDVTESSTTLMTFTNKMRLTTPFLTSGLYKIEWSFNYKHKPGKEIIVRIQVDDSTTIHDFNWKSAKMSSDYVLHDSGFNIVNLTNGIHNIDVDYKTVNKGVAYIWNVKLLITSLDI